MPAIQSIPGYRKRFEVSQNRHYKAVIRSRVTLIKVAYELSAP